MEPKLVELVLFMDGQGIDHRKGKNHTIDLVQSQKRNGKFHISYFPRQSVIGRVDDFQDLGNQCRFAADDRRGLDSESY